MELHIGLSYHWGVERLNFYVENLNLKLQEKTQNKDFGLGIKIFSIGLTCFLGTNQKTLFIFHQGKKIKRLRTFGLREFEDYMEILYSLDIEKVIVLLQIANDSEIYSYLEDEIFKAVETLKTKYIKKTPDFNWNKLLDEFPMVIH